LYNSTTIYNNNKKHLFYQKARQITCHFPRFLIKYALFSYYSKLHKNYAKISKHFLFFVALLFSTVSFAHDKSQINIAVAANFYHVAKELSYQFTTKTGFIVNIASGSSGKLYSQIQNGAPFDIFFSANSKHPLQLENKKRKSFVYAIGRLVLWSYDKNINLTHRTFFENDIKHIVIANEKLAPYGEAAISYLKKIKVYKKIQDKLIRAENIASAFALSQTQSVDFALLSYASFKLKKQIKGKYYLLPTSTHLSIVQRAIQLNDKKETMAFLQFIKSSMAVGIIKKYGFVL
jgi:molybdate transport system substrate-binding protein